MLSEWDGRAGIGALIFRPNFHLISIFSENLAAVEMKKTSVLLNKPMYAGAVVLDVSKVKLYSFLYDYIYPTFGKNAKLLYTDTDSLILEIKNHNIYGFIKKDSDRFDTSNFDPKNELLHGKELGLMKSETGDKPVLRFICVRAKVYAIITADRETKRLKGVKKIQLQKIFLSKTLKIAYLIMNLLLVIKIVLDQKIMYCILSVNIN